MEALGCRVDSKPYSVLGMVWESRGLFAGRKKQCLAGCRTEQAAKFKGSKAEIRQGVSLLALGMLLQVICLHFTLGYRQLMCAAVPNGLARVGWIFIQL